MSNVTKNVAAAVVAILVATSSIATVVTVPGVDNGSMMATAIDAPELA